jgi:hypothetical protein
MLFIIDTADKSEAKRRLQKNLFFETSDALLNKLADRNDIEECSELNFGDKDEK